MDFYNLLGNICVCASLSPVCVLMWYYLPMGFAAIMEYFRRKKTEEPTQPHENPGPVLTLFKNWQIPRSRTSTPNENQEEHLGSDSASSYSESDFFPKVAGNWKTSKNKNVASAKSEAGEADLSLNGTMRIRTGRHIKEILQLPQSCVNAKYSFEVKFIKPRD